MESFHLENTEVSYRFIYKTLSNLINKQILIFK